MSNQQQEIYNNYLATFADVVRPTTTKNAWPVKLDGEKFEKTDWTRKVGESYSTKVWLSSAGRVVEVEPIGNGWNNLFHTFETEQDWRNFRKPMGMFHYLNT